MTEKIQKVLAAQGIASRRAIENMISQGRILINGRLATIGERITYNAKICVDNKKINLSKRIIPKTRTILYHKPTGEICTRSDPENRTTVYDNLPRLNTSRWISVGRLDYNTSGILIFTNSGMLANKLMHPSSNIEREYAVRIRGQITKPVLKKLKSGIKLEDGIAYFKNITYTGGSGSNHWYNVTIELGKNRIVRRLFASQDLSVSRLIRIRFGKLTLPANLRRGSWVEITQNQLKELILVKK